VGFVLDGPVAADPVGRVHRFRLVGKEIGDRVDSLGGEASRFIEPASAYLYRLGGVGKVDAGGDGQDLQGANLSAAVTAVGGAVGDRNESPGQAGQLLVQIGLVALDGQNPVRAAPKEAGDVVALTMHRVGGHDGAARTPI
jgi:hypothetical protein